MICFSIKLEQQSGLIFFPEGTSWEYYKEYYAIEWVHTQCVGLINLFEGLNVGGGGGGGLFDGWRLKISRFDGWRLTVNFSEWRLSHEFKAQISLYVLIKRYNFAHI